jgi:uncharacterized protein with PIN domain
MLGKLARWLRMLGHDVRYSVELDDAQLLAVARKERRTLLTKDLALYQQATAKGIEALYTDGQTEGERLAEVAKRFGVELEIDMNVSRCPKCNTRVRPVPKETVAERVEDNTFSNYDEFWRCPKCSQIYWQGAHWTKIRKTLEMAKKEKEETYFSNHLRGMS